MIPQVLIGTARRKSGQGPTLNALGRRLAVSNSSFPPPRANEICQANRLLADALRRAAPWSNSRSSRKHDPAGLLIRNVDSAFHAPAAGFNTILLSASLRRRILFGNTGAGGALIFGHRFFGHWRGLCKRIRPRAIGAFNFRRWQHINACLHLLRAQGVQRHRHFLPGYQRGPRAISSAGKAGFIHRVQWAVQSLGIPQACGGNLPDPAAPSGSGATSAPLPIA